MEQEMLDRINRRLEALEVVHTRYSGPPGKPAKITLGRVESGDTASAQIREVGGNVYELNLVIPRGEDSTELETLRAERDAFREELNAFLKELHDFRAAACAEMRELSAEYAERLAEIYRREVDGMCESKNTRPL